MTSKTPSAGNAVATGIASGSLGTGTAVDEETTRIALPEILESTERPKTVTTAPTAATTPPAATAPAAAPVTAVHRPTARRDPYRPIGIALAAILMALAGLAVLSSGGDSPTDAGAAPGASQTFAPGAPTDEDAGAGGDQDDGDGGGQKGNCNGRGNDPCDREDGGGD
jgi:hypothetical protein